VLLKLEETKLSFDHIKQKVIQRITAPVKTEADLSRFLCGWWSRHYNRPYKDPLLKEYTLEELLTEYLDNYYRTNEKALAEETSGKAQASEDEAWLEKMTSHEEEAEEDQVGIDRSAKQKQFYEKLKEEGLATVTPEVKDDLVERHIDFLGK
jgi:hypothetical protein